MTESKQETIVFFDGYCGLCNHFVDFLMTRDLNRRLRFAPLQGETARSYLDENRRSDLDTVVVVTRDAHGAMAGQLLKSDAALYALGELSPDWAAFTRALRATPRFFRDAIYDLVARNRFKLFGKREMCRIPSPEERERFLR